MNELFSLGMNISEMQKIGVRLGADVPAAFTEKLVIARGIGEKLEEFEAKLKYFVVLIKPSFSCDTKSMYNILDNNIDIKQKHNSKRVIEAIENQDIQMVADNIYNVFESSVDGIDNIKNELLENGANGALMTGSGSCVYGIFQDKKCAKAAFRNLSKKYETYFSVTK